MLDASGFVRRSQVFAGNVKEHRTLAGMLEATTTKEAQSCNGNWHAMMAIQMISPIVPPFSLVHRPSLTVF